MHSVVCLSTGPQPLPKRVLHRVRSSVSSFNFQYPFFSLRSSSNFLPFLDSKLLPCSEYCTLFPCNSPACEFYMPTFRITLFHLHRRVGTYLPMKMKQSVPKRRHIKFLHLLPCLPVTFNLSSIFLSITCFRTQFLRNVSLIHLVMFML